MKKIIFIFLSSFIILTTAFLFLLIPLSLFLLTSLSFKASTEEDLFFVVFWGIIGLIMIALSLIPSYKITILLKKLLEKRGWKIEKPGRLFLFSLLLLLILFFGLPQLLK